MDKTPVFRYNDVGRIGNPTYFQNLRGRYSFLVT